MDHEPENLVEVVAVLLLQFYRAMEALAGLIAWLLWSLWQLTPAGWPPGVRFLVYPAAAALAGALVGGLRRAFRAWRTWY